MPTVRPWALGLCLAHPGGEVCLGPQLDQPHPGIGFQGQLPRSRAC